MSDTPEVDAILPPGSGLNPEVSHRELELAGLARQLTRDLAAARERVRELRENGARLVEAADGWKIRCQAEEIIRVRVEAERDALRELLKEAQLQLNPMPDAMEYVGETEAAESFRALNRRIDAAIDAGRKG